MSDSPQPKQIIRGFINRTVSIDSLDDEDNLFDSGIINSLFAVQLLTFLERTFGIEVGLEDLDLENFKSISAAASFVERKSRRSSTPAAPAMADGTSL